MGDQRVDALQSLISDLLQDPALAEQLKNDPRATLESRYGVQLPDSLEVEVLQETTNKTYIVLPAMAAAESELSDADLSAVAGGSGGSTFIDTSADCWLSKGTACV